MRFGSFGSTARVFFLRKIAGGVGKNVFIGPHVTIVHPENLFIGNNVSIRQDVYIDCTARVLIGNDVSVAHSVSIISFNHSYDSPDKIRDNKLISGPILINDDCWIGCRSVLLSGVTLQSRTIVGAGAVVNRSFEGDCILGGVPARIIKDISRNET